MYLNEAKIQKMMRLNKMFMVLTKSEDKFSQFFKLKLPILEIFYNIFLDCEINNEELRA